MNNSKENLIRYILAAGALVIIGAILIQKYVREDIGTNVKTSLVADMYSDIEKNIEENGDAIKLNDEIRLNSDTNGIESEAETEAPPSSETVASSTTTGIKLSEMLAGDDPVRGAASAPLTIVEFSDYQCPFCKQVYDNSYQQLKAEYIDTGKVKHIYRDLPLQVHKQAVPAALAANCAGEQEKYWEMHDLLFENQDNWSNTINTTERFTELAQTAGLNTTTFQTCLDTNNIEEIQNDITDALQNNVRSTPTIIIGDEILVGAQPYEVIKPIIESALNQT